MTWTVQKVLFLGHYPKILHTIYAGKAKNKWFIWKWAVSWNGQGWPRWPFRSKHNRNYDRTRKIMAKKNYPSMSPYKLHKIRIIEWNIIIPDRMIFVQSERLRMRGCLSFLFDSIHLDNMINVFSGWILSFRPECLCIFIVSSMSISWHWHHLHE